MVQRERLLDVEAQIFAGVLRDLTRGASPSGQRLMRAARALLTGTNWLLPYYQGPSQVRARADLVRRTLDVALLLVSGARQVLKGKGVGR